MSRNERIMAPSRGRGGRLVLPDALYQAALYYVVASRFATSSVMETTHGAEDTSVTRRDDLVGDTRSMQYTALTLIHDVCDVLAWWRTHLARAATLDETHGMSHLRRLTCNHRDAVIRTGGTNVIDGEQMHDGGDKGRMVANPTGGVCNVTCRTCLDALTVDTFVAQFVSEDGAAFAQTVPTTEQAEEERVVRSVSATTMLLIDDGHGHPVGDAGKGAGGGRVSSAHDLVLDNEQDVQPLMVRQGKGRCERKERRKRRGDVLQGVQLDGGGAVSRLADGAVRRRSRRLAVQSGGI